MTKNAQTYPLHNICTLASQQLITIYKKTNIFSYPHIELELQKIFYLRRDILILFQNALETSPVIYLFIKK